MTSYILNAFSIQMLNSDCSVRFEKVETLPSIDTLTSAIGHPDIAAVVGVPMNRIAVSLNKGDVAYVVQFTGGRLPEGSVTLPEGFTCSYWKITVE